jgi:hypothetical protein
MTNETRATTLEGLGRARIEVERALRARYAMREDGWCETQAVGNNARRPRSTSENYFGAEGDLAWGSRAKALSARDLL